MEGGKINSFVRLDANMGKLYFARRITTGDGTLKPNAKSVAEHRARAENLAKKNERDRIKDLYRLACQNAHVHAKRNGTVYIKPPRPPKETTVQMTDDERRKAEKIEEKRAKDAKRKRLLKEQPGRFTTQRCNCLPQGTCSPLLDSGCMMVATASFCIADCGERCLNQQRHWCDRVQGTAPGPARGPGQELATAAGPKLDAGPGSVTAAANGSSANEESGRGAKAGPRAGEGAGASLHRSHPGIEVRSLQTGDRGLRGVFALRDYPAKCPVGVFDGERMTRAGFDKALATGQLSEADKSFVSIGRGSLPVVVPTVHGVYTPRASLLTRANHSCASNMIAHDWFCPVSGLHVQLLFTTRAVAAGEELTWDYGKEYPRMACKCGAMECRGFVGR